MGFQGFSEATLQFLAELSANNDRDWFEANRGRWDQDLLAPARAFVEAIAPGIHAIDPELDASPKVGGAIFRLHRDTRFSKDKRPFKEELAFRFAADGAASGLFLRLRPGLVGFAAGCWTFEPPQLARFRAAVAAESGAALDERVQTLGKSGCGYESQPLKRVPAPWPAEHPRAHLLKARGLIVGVDRPIPDSFASPAFADWCLARLEEVAPVHQWLRENVG